MREHINEKSTRADISPALKKPDTLLRRLRVIFLSWWLFTLYVRSCSPTALISVLLQILMQVYAMPYMLGIRSSHIEVVPAWLCT